MLKYSWCKVWFSAFDNVSIRPWLFEFAAFLFEIQPCFHQQPINRQLSNIEQPESFNLYLTTVWILAKWNEQVNSCAHQNFFCVSKTSFKPRISLQNTMGTLSHLYDDGKIFTEFRCCCIGTNDAEVSSLPITSLHSKQLRKYTQWDWKWATSWKPKVYQIAQWFRIE